MLRSSKQKHTRLRSEPSFLSNQSLLVLQGWVFFPGLSMDPTSRVSANRRLRTSTHHPLFITRPPPHLSTAITNPSLPFTLLALRDQGSPEGPNSLKPLHFRHA